MVKAASEATQKLTTAGSCCHPRTGRAIKTGGVTRVQKSWLRHSCCIGDGWAVVRSWSLGGTSYNQTPQEHREGGRAWFLLPLPFPSLAQSLTAISTWKPESKGSPQNGVSCKMKQKTERRIWILRRQSSYPPSFSTHQSVTGWFWINH